MRGAIPWTYYQTMAHEVIAAQLIWNCLTGKRTNFSEEQEVRYVIMGECNSFDGICKAHNSRHYVELPLKLKVPCGIMQILVGASAPLGAEEMIDDFLKAQGYPDGIPIRRSMVRF
jgi:hypothetical protein